jgi:hypothetical protein
MNYAVRPQELVKEARDSLREMGEGFDKDDRLVIVRLSCKLAYSEEDRDYWKTLYLNR